MKKISKIEARRILNSDGRWTVECKLFLENGCRATASVPQGISTGKHEKEAVTTKLALKQIEVEISPRLTEAGPLNQYKLDQILTENPQWGSNATLAISAAFAKATGFLKSRLTTKLPKISMLIFEGKKHGNEALRIQEFMIVVNRIEEGIRFYQKIRKFLERKKIITTVGKEGGFSPPGISDEEILAWLKNVGAPAIALDVAANTNPLPLTTLFNIVRRYPIVSLEDPLPENKPNRWRSFSREVKKIAPQILIVADDLTVTNPAKIREGAKKKLFQGVIIKPNQQGTISKALEAAKVARQNNLKVIVSHRGGETNDTWIADFALKVGADFVKFGAPCRGERVAKYNRLLHLTT